MHLFYFLILCSFCLCDILASPIKALHLTFHRGCAKQVETIANHFSIDLTTWYIPDLPPLFFDGCTQGSALYNIGHRRAQNIWNLHAPFFQQFDLILTSDTAALSRIFLQNNSSTPLIIWICNRFDYHDTATLDCSFPDAEYYRLFQSAQNLPHVAIVANTAFEHLYAQSKKVNTGSLVIQPIGSFSGEEKSAPPSHPEREKTFYLPPYHNESIFMNLSQHLSDLQIPNYCGRHNGLGDLSAYKGIIHLPYSWSTIALFENLEIGVPYFIPSKTFLAQLHLQGNYWHQNAAFLFDEKLYDISEWYSEDHRSLFTYFDSWHDLLIKIRLCNFPQKKEAIKKLAKTHQEIMLAKWQAVFKKILPEDK